MKRNAVIRIIVWSLVILCLTSILLSGLGLRSYRTSTAIFDRGYQTEVNATLSTHPEFVPEILVLRENSKVYTSPSESGSVAGELEAGTEVTITRREQVNGKDWGYTTAPLQGWILTEAPAGDNVPVTESTVPDKAPYTEPQEIYGSSLPAEEVSAISIDWHSGNIRIVPGDGSRISMEEPETDRPFVWKLKDNKLSIDFCEDSFWKSFGINNIPSKDLTITVPKDWICRELEIDAASANLEVRALTIWEVEMDAASGRTEFIDCTVGNLDVDTASGDVFFTGTLDTMECDAASADFIATLSNTPRQLEMSSASGSLDLTLPADTGFSVRMEGLKQQFSSDFDTTMRNGAYVHGDGGCRIEMEAMSGGVIIRKGS